MILTLLILTLSEIQIRDDYFDYLGNTIHRPFQHFLQSEINSKSWYFIHFPELNNKNCRDKLTDENGLDLDVDSSITSRICLAFLEPDNYTSIRSYYKSKHEKIIIHPLTSTDKLHHTTDELELDYMARFHRSFTPPKNLRGNLTKLSNEIYLYTIQKGQKGTQTEILSEILTIPELRSISPKKPTRFLNRWNSGFIQKNEWPGGYDIYDPKLNFTEFFPKGDLHVNRLFNEKGLDGTGQVITIVDSGINLNSPYFREADNKPLEYDKMDMTRRKVVFITTFADHTDSVSNHGTHVAGIVAGKPLYPSGSDQNSEAAIYEYKKLSLYNGVAPGAKIAVVDITNDYSNGQSSAVSFPSILFGEAMGKANSKIAICGWGNSNNIEQSYYYDLLAESIPGRLLVFAVGNNGPSFQSILTPADGKNVLSVGALEPLWTSLLESLRAYALVSGDQRLPLMAFPCGRDLFYIENFKIENARAVTSLPQSSSNFVFFTNDTDFCTTLADSPSAPLPSAVVYVGASYNESFCSNLSNFSFPVFFLNDTSMPSFDSVSIVVDIQSNPDPLANLVVARYSSRGPNYAGVMKPDVVAPGTNVYSADSDFVTPLSGTSYAAAYVAGAAALVYDYFEKGFYPTGVASSSNSFSPASDLVRAVIVASADPIPIVKRNETKSGRLRGPKTPNCVSGHGVVNLANVLTFKPNMKLFMKIKVYNEQHFFTRFKLNANLVREGNIDLRIASAYKDASSTNNFLALEENIDMYLVLPNKSVVYGNHRPGGNEERFSTIERIIMFSEELLQILESTNGKENVYELHFVTGSHFTNLRRNGLMSLFISGPFNNVETSSKKSIQYSESANFSFEDPEDKNVADFTFFRANKTKCTDPSYGIHCQHTTTAIPNDGSEVPFDIYDNTACLLTLPLPSNYTKIILKLRRDPPISGRLSLQLAINANYEYGNEYGFIVSISNPNSLISLTKDMFGFNQFVGIRVANLVGYDLKIFASFTYQIPTPAPTLNYSVTVPFTVQEEEDEGGGPEPVPKKIKNHVIISFTLFGFFFVTAIVFAVLLGIVSRKLKIQRKVKNDSYDEDIKKEDTTDNNESQDNILKQNPI